MDDKTEAHTTLSITEEAGNRTQSVVFGSKKEIKEGLEIAADRTYAKSKDNLTQSDTYGLIKEKEGKKINRELDKAKFAKQFRGF